MRRRLATALAGIAGLLSFGAPAAMPSSAGTETTRIERLAGLARTWGMVRYLHPALATRPVDWDKALVEAIPEAERAQSRAEYIRALNGMLSSLGDPATRARPAGTDARAPHAQHARTTADAVRLGADGVLRIDVAESVRGIAEGNDDLPAKAGELAGDARGVLLDLRRESHASAEDASAEERFLRQVFWYLDDRQVALPALRFRMHNGMAPRNGSGSGAGYYSAFSTQAPLELNYRWSNKRTIPMAVVVDADSTSIDLVLGVRGAGLAWVVQEGTAPNANAMATLHPVDGVDLDLSVGERVAADGTVGFSADDIVPAGQGIDAAFKALSSPFPRTPPPRTTGPSPVPRSEFERDYREMSFPAREYRLLALFRYWNAIEYFYPNKDMLGGDWGDALARYIPRVESDADAVDYQRTLAELVTEIHDSHGFIGGIDALNERLGMYVPPLRLRWVEAQSVVVRVLDPALPVRAGDIVLSVDGMPVEQLRQERARLIAASTPQALQRDVHLQLLRGTKGSLARLLLRGIDGGTREVAVPRSLELYGAPYWNAGKRNGAVVDVLPGGIGYVDLDRLQDSEVDAMFARLRKAPAIIFDMRGYPNGTAWRIAPRLGTRHMPIAALFSRPIVEANMLGNGDLAEWPRYQFAQPVPAAEGERYTGKVVMLIDEESLSQAEHTGLFFEAATPTTFVGSPTAGADGDVTTLVLPGGLYTTFSGMTVSHADGRQLQRLGLQPDIHAAPSIAGIATGRDEVLEAAIKFLHESQ